jgi:hypothetical protein
VCQIVAVSPSTAFVAAPFSPASSALSALTVQPLRDSTCPSSSIRLISDADVHGLPFTSDRACKRTKRETAGSNTLQTNCVLIVCTPSEALTATRKRPSAVAAPLITPVAVLMLSPAGRPLAP